MQLQEIKNKINSKEYDFLKTNKHLGDNIILLTLGGSHAYGTDTENSDLDIRGITLNKPQELLGLSEFEQFIDNDTDTTIYSFNKIVQLLLNCNPNTIEMLGCKDEHYFILTQEGEMLKNNINLFLSQTVIHSFGGYANVQLRRLQNALAKDYYPQAEKEKHILGSIKNQINHFNNIYKSFHKNNMKLYLDDTEREIFDKEIFIDINLKHYPLRDLKNIFSEMNNIIKNYDKLNHRNKKKDELHLNKHAMHLIRLYLMAIDILKGKGIKTYRDKDRKLLMDIRNGKYMTENGKYKEEFFFLIDELEKDFQYAQKHTVLPIKPDIKRIEDLVMEINIMSLRRARIW